MILLNNALTSDGFCSFYILLMTAPQYFQEFQLKVLIESVRVG